MLFVEKGRRQKKKKPQVRWDNFWCLHSPYQKGKQMVLPNLWWIWYRAISFNITLCCKDPDHATKVSTWELQSFRCHPRVFKTLMRDRKASLPNLFTYLSLPAIHTGRGKKTDAEKDKEDKERASYICILFMRRKTGFWIPVLQPLPPWVILEKEVLFEPLSHHLLKKEGGREERGWRWKDRRGEGREEGRL